jgi:hypothetical protein
MLRYVADRRLRSPGAIIRLARVARRDPAFRRALPRLALRWPGLLRLIEPIRPSMQHGLSRRLHLAAMVAESLPDEPPQPGLGVLTKEMLLEAGALPFRLAFARVYA